MDQLYLVHHGIKGQKWGVRRFQNEDGTWTEAGKERYGSSIRTQKKDILNNLSLEEKRRRADLKKVAIGGAIAAGILLGGYAAYKINDMKGVNKDIILKGKTVIQRITPDKTLYDEFYAAYGDHDKKRYNAKLKEHFGNKGHKDICKHQLEAISDVKIASLKSGREAYRDLMNSDLAFANRFRRISYNEFNRALVGNHMDPDVQKFYRELKNRGYAGLIDYNDKRISGYMARTPAIIIDSKKFVQKSIDNYNPSVKDINKDNWKWVGEQLVDAYSLYMLAGGAIAAGASYSSTKELRKNNKELFKDIDKSKSSNKKLSEE